MKEDFSVLLNDTIHQLPAGAFLVSGAEGNPMTIGWAQFGIIWGKPICTVFVRHSRYSHKLMEHDRIFTVSVPQQGMEKEALAFCGKKSGCDIDKKSQLNLTFQVTPSGGKCLSNCHIHFVCKTVAKTEMDMDSIDPQILHTYYNTNQATNDGDPHTIYFGEILEAFSD